MSLDIVFLDITLDILFMFLDCQFYCSVCKGLLARESAVVEYDMLAGRVGKAITRIAITWKLNQLATRDFTGT